MISANNEKNVDIVFCIDTTGSNGFFLEDIQYEFKGFYAKLGTSMKEKFDQVLNRLNVRVIAFKDYLFDEDPMLVSEWYPLSDEGEDNFLDFLKRLDTGGGGDEPESGLEALYYGMTTDWIVGEDSRRDRQIIVLFTNADAHPLRYYTGLPFYPHDMVDNEGLIRTWMGDPPAHVRESMKLSQRCKRLLIFAPGCTAYEQLMGACNHMVFSPLDHGRDLYNLTMEEILASISAVACSG